jgi:hypothetical protein
MSSRVTRHRASPSRLRPFHRARRAFLLVKSPSVKKLLAYEKEVNEGFAKTA